MTKSLKAFTIVELLIVIVVIGILASMVISTYSGVQERAKNVKTISAVQAWAKALQLYYIDNSANPPSSCLGSSYPADSPNNEVAGNCTSTSGWAYNATFVNKLKPYINADAVTPDLTIIAHDVTDPTSTRRGAMFGTSSGNPSIWFTVSAPDGKCPDVGGLSNMTRTLGDGHTNGTGISCRGEIAI